MYGHHSIALPLGFMLMTGILCWYLAHAAGRWQVKLALIVLLAGFGLDVSRSLDSYAGWPTDEDLPEDAELLAATFREPSPRVNDPGEIVVWVRPLSPLQTGLLRETPSYDEPRAYRIPYSRKMHEEMEGDMEKIRAGQHIGLHRGRRKGKRGSGEGAGDGDGNGDGDNGYGEDEDGLHTYALPASQPPRKETKGAHD